MLNIATENEEIKTEKNRTKQKNENNLNDAYTEQFLPENNKRRRLQ